MPEEGAEQVEVLRQSLAARARDFEDLHARRYTDDDVSRDRRWADEMANYRKMRMEIQRREARASGITQGLVGGCEFFIGRRRRFCCNMAAVGNADHFCTEHAAGSFDSQSASKQGRHSDNGQARAYAPKKVVPRMHYMVNPFNMPAARPPEPWGEVFSDLTRPLLLDVGCAKGRWIQHMAAETSVRLQLQGKPFNYCGVEIYGPLVELAKERRDTGVPAWQKSNLHYVHANIITSLRTLELPNLHTICFQFCDPWLKKRRRRTVTPEVAAEVARLLPPGGQVYVVSDYLELARDMRALFLATGAFMLSRTPSCDVIPVEEAAVVAAERMNSELDTWRPRQRAWQMLPSVVSWSAQVCERAHGDCGCISCRSMCVAKLSLTLSRIRT